MSGKSSVCRAFVSLSAADRLVPDTRVDEVEDSSCSLNVAALLHSVILEDLLGDVVDVSAVAALSLFLGAA